jgi:hypothetical protein
MKLSNNTAISYLKSDAKRIVTEPKETHLHPIITQNGGAKPAVEDISTFDRQRQTNTLLCILALGQKEIAGAKFSSAADVLAELDRLDEEYKE